MTEIRRNDDGTLDEIASDETEGVHLEQMDDGAWWLGIDTPTGRIMVYLYKRGRKIHANVIDER